MALVGGILTAVGIAGMAGAVVGLSRLSSALGALGALDSACFFFPPRFFSTAEGGTEGGAEDEVSGVLLC